MDSDLAICPKCSKRIIRSNMLLHESTCRGQNQYISDHSNDTSIVTFNNNNIEGDLYHCNECDMYMETFEKGDHILSHQYARDFNQQHSDEDQEDDEEEEEEVNDNRNLRNSSIFQMPQIRLNPYNNNVHTETRTITQPNGSVTTITRTVTGNNLNEIRFNSNYGDGVQLRGVQGHGNNQQRVFGSFPGFNLISNSNELTAFLQNVLTGLNPEHPVSDDILSLLNEITIEDVNKLPSEKRDCVVCLCNYEVGNKVLILPCTHIFHTGCIKDWFKTQDTCPICKFKIDSNSLNSN
jgi:hypothetical protein